MVLASFMCGGNLRQPSTLAHHRMLYREHLASVVYNINKWIQKYRGIIQVDRKMSLVIKCTYIFSLFPFDNPTPLLRNIYLVSASSYQSCCQLCSISMANYVTILLSSSILLSLSESQHPSLGPFQYHF